MPSQETATRRNPPSAQPNPPSNKPVEKFREGRVHVSIGENNGVNGAFRTASFEIRYRQGNDWQSGASYGLDDLAYLELAAKQARTRIEQWKRGVAENSSTPAVEEARRTRFDLGPNRGKAINRAPCQLDFAQFRGRSGSLPRAAVEDCRRREYPRRTLRSIRTYGTRKAA